MARSMHRIFALLLCGLVTACMAPGTPDTQAADQRAIADLSALLAPLTTAREAAEVAQTAVTYSRQLQVDYQVTDPPLVHNFKVNQGLRPRGLCYHWADDLEARLRELAPKGLSLHRAIANSDSLLIDHSTVIVSALGAPMEDGIVLDPWRFGGQLFFAPVPKDTRYRWVPRAEVFAKRAARSQEN